MPPLEPPQIQMCRTATVYCTKKFTTATHNALQCNKPRVHH